MKDTNPKPTSHPTPKAGATDNDGPPHYWLVGDVAMLCRVTPQAVHEDVKAGKLRVIATAGKQKLRLIEADEAWAYYERRRERAAR